jgi:uncharacterized protein
MAGIKEDLRADLTTALKAGDTDTVSTIRMTLTAISREEVAGKEARDLSDDEVIAVLSSELKKRREAAQAFSDAGRTKLAQQEQAEADVLARYLPQPLTDDEVDALVAQSVAAARAQGLEGGRAMGAVMKALKPDTTGRVDGATLAAKVKQALAG